MNLVTWSPLRELDAMERRMRRMFEGTGVSTLPPLPAADIYETDDEIVAELEVPGFAEDELDIEVHDRTLVIKGERAEESEEKDKAYLRRERTESRFERRFTLPTEADVDHIAAHHEKGVLEVHVPKKSEAHPRKVEIEAK